MSDEPRDLEAIREWINTRPLAASDFSAGMAAVSVTRLTYRSVPIG